MIVAAQSWPEGSENQAFDAQQALTDLLNTVGLGMDGLGPAGDRLSSGEAWAAPALAVFQQNRMNYLYTPGTGLYAVHSNLQAYVMQVGNFGFNTEFSKISINVAVWVLLIMVFISLLLAFFTGGASAADIGPAVAATRETIAGIMSKLATAVAEKFGAEALEDVAAAGVKDVVTAGVEAGVEDTVAAGLADTVATDVADTVATDLADTVATDLADTVATDLADTVATDVADTVATDVADTVATDVADTVATDLSDTAANEAGQAATRTAAGSVRSTLTGNALKVAAQGIATNVWANIEELRHDPNASWNWTSTIAAVAAAPLGVLIAHPLQNVLPRLADNAALSLSGRALLLAGRSAETGLVMTVAMPASMALAGLATTGHLDLSHLSDPATYLGAFLNGAVLHGTTEAAGMLGLAGHNWAVNAPDTVAAPTDTATALATPSTETLTEPSPETSTPALTDAEPSPVATVAPTAAEPSTTASGGVAEPATGGTPPTPATGAGESARASTATSGKTETASKTTTGGDGPPPPDATPATADSTTTTATTPDGHTPTPTGDGPPPPADTATPDTTPASPDGHPAPTGDATTPPTDTAAPDSTPTAGPNGHPATTSDTGLAQLADTAVRDGSTAATPDAAAVHPNGSDAAVPTERTITDPAATLNHDAADATVTVAGDSGPPPPEGSTAPSNGTLPHRQAADSTVPTADQTLTSPDGAVPAERGPEETVIPVDPTLTARADELTPATPVSDEIAGITPTLAEDVASLPVARGDDTIIRIDGEPAPRPGEIVEELPPTEAATSMPAERPVDPSVRGDEAPRTAAATAERAAVRVREDGTRAREDDPAGIAGRDGSSVSLDDAGAARVTADAERADLTGTVDEPAKTTGGAGDVETGPPAHGTSQEAADASTQTGPGQPDGRFAPEGMPGADHAEPETAAQAAARVSGEDLAGRISEHLDPLRAEHPHDVPPDVLVDLARNGDQVAKMAAVVERILQVKEYASLKWTQLFAAHALIEGRTFDQAAGEGKTEAFDTASGVLALEHGSVLRITSSKTLAGRDAAMLARLLEPLGIDVVQVDHNVRLSDPRLSESPRPTVYVADIHEVGFYHNHWEEALPADVLVVDEVDVLKDLVDRGMVFIESDGIHDLASPEVTAQVHWAEGTLSDGTFTDADFTRGADGSWQLTDSARARLADTLPEHPAGTFGDEPLTEAERRLTRAFTGDKLLENKDYLVYRGPDGDEPGKILIINPLTGEPLHDPATNLEQRWQDGLAQALEAKHGIDIHADPESNRTTPLQDVLNSYSIKVGASGTAKPAETALQSLGFGDVAEVPRHDLNRLTSRPDSLHETEVAAQQAAVDDIIENWNKGTGRPQQVIVHRNDWVAEITRQLIDRGVPRESIEALDAKWIMDQGTNRDAAMEAAFGEAGQMGKITITGGFGGRGTNIKPVDDAYVLDAGGNRVGGGLRVLGTGRAPETARIDIQLETRAGRNGNPGEAQFYGYLDHELFQRYAGHPEVARFQDEVRNLLAQEDSPARQQALDDLGRQHAALVRTLQDATEYHTPIAVSRPAATEPVTGTSDPAPEAHTYRPLQHAPPESTGTADGRGVDTGQRARVDAYIHIPSGETPDQSAAVDATTRTTLPGAVDHAATPTLAAAQAQHQIPDQATTPAPAATSAPAQHGEQASAAATLRQSGDQTTAVAAQQASDPAAVEKQVAVTAQSAGAAQTAAAAQAAAQHGTVGAQQPGSHAPPVRPAATAVTIPDATADGQTITPPAPATAGDGRTAAPRSGITDGTKHATDARGDVVLGDSRVRPPGPGRAADEWQDTVGEAPAGDDLAGQRQAAGTGPGVGVPLAEGHQDRRGDDHAGTHDTESGEAERGADVGRGERVASSVPQLRHIAALADLTAALDQIGGSDAMRYAVVVSGANAPDAIQSTIEGEVEATWRAFVAEQLGQLLDAGARGVNLETVAADDPYRHALGLDLPAGQRPAVVLFVGDPAVYARLTAAANEARGISPSAPESAEVGGPVSTIAAALSAPDSAVRDTPESAGAESPEAELGAAQPAHAGLAGTGLPYRRQPGQRSNREALDHPSPRAVGRTPALVWALAGFLYRLDLTGGVDPAEVRFEIAEDPRSVDELDFHEQLARTSTTEDLVLLGPGAFDDGLPLLARVLLNELARVRQRRGGVTDPHDRAANDAAEAAQRGADGIFWDTVAIDGGAVVRWQGPQSLSGPRSNRSVAADPSTLPHAAQVVRELAALLGLDFSGVDIVVVEDAAEFGSLDAQELAAETPFDQHGQQIRFGPAAFASWDTLAKTIAYQHHRASRLRAERPPVLAPAPELEADAIRLLVDQTLADLADNEAALATLAGRYGGVNRAGQVIDFHENRDWPTAQALAAKAERATTQPPGLSSFRPDPEELARATPAQLRHLTAAQQREALRELSSQTPPPGQRLPAGTAALADAALDRVWDNRAHLLDEVRGVTTIDAVGAGWFQVTTTAGQRIVVGIARSDTAEAAVRTARIGPAELPAYLITVPESPAADDPNLTALDSERVEIQVARELASLTATLNTTAPATAALDEAGSVVAGLVDQDIRARLTAALDRARAATLDARPDPAALDDAATALTTAAETLDQATASAIQHAAQTLHAAAATLTIPDSLQPGYEIQRAMSSADHAAATELRVRARQLDHWRRGRTQPAAGPSHRRSNPLTRRTGTWARRAELRNLIGRLGLAATSRNVSERQRLLVDSRYRDAADLAAEHGPRRRVRWAIPAPHTPERPAAYRVNGPTILRAGNLDELRQAWERATQISQHAARITVAIDPAWTVASPAYIPLVSRRIGELAADTLLANPDDSVPARAVVNPRFAELLRDNPELAEVLQDPQLARLLTAAELADLARDPELPELLAAARQTTDREPRQALVRRLAEQAGEPELSDRLAAIADTADEAAVDNLLGRLSDLAADPELGGLLRRLSELADDPELAGLLTGEAVVPFGEPAVVNTPDASDADILRADAALDEQPDVVVFLGDFGRLAQLETTARQLRSSALDYVTPAQLTDLTDEQRAEALRRLSEQTAPAHMPTEPGLARIWADAGQLEADINQVASIERVGSGWYQVTTTGGRRVLVGASQGPTPDGTAAHTARVPGDQPTYLITLTDARTDDVVREPFDDWVNEGLAADKAEVLFAGQLAVLSTQLDTDSQLDHVRDRLDAAHAGVAGLTDESGISTARRGELLAAIDAARSVLDTPDDALRRGPHASAKITAVTTWVSLLAAGNDAATTALQTVQEAADALAHAAVVPSTPDTLRPAHGTPDTLSREDHSAATELRVRARLLAEWQRGHSGASTDPFTRWRGTQARRHRIETLIGRLGLSREAVARDQRFDLLRRARFDDIVEMADEYGSSRRARQRQPLTIDPWWVAETTPELAAAAGASAITRIADDVFRVRYGTDGSFTIAVALDGNRPADAAPVDLVIPAASTQPAQPGRWELAGEISRAVELHRLAAGEHASLAEMAERAARGELGPDLLVPTRLSVLVHSDTPLSADDRSTVGWVRAFREDYEAAGWRERRAMRRTFREIAGHTGLLRPMLGLRGSADYSRRLAAVQAYDADLAGFITHLNGSRPGLLPARAAPAEGPHERPTYRFDAPETLVATDAEQLRQQWAHAFAITHDTRRIVLVNGADEGSALDRQVSELLRHSFVVNAYDKANAHIVVSPELSELLEGPGGRELEDVLRDPALAALDRGLVDRLVELAAEPAVAAVLDDHRLVTLIVEGDLAGVLKTPELVSLLTQLAGLRGNPDLVARLADPALRGLSGPELADALGPELTRLLGGSTAIPPPARQLVTALARAGESGPGPLEDLHIMLKGLLAVHDDPDLPGLIEQLSAARAANTELADVLTGTAVVRLSDTPDAWPAEASDEQILASSRPVGEQPDVIVFAGHDPDRLDRLQDAMAANRSAALDYFNRADWEQYTGGQRDEVASRLLSGGSPERRPQEDGAALFWDHATRIAEDADDVATIERRGTNCFLVTTTRGNQFLWTVERGRTDPGTSAQHRHLANGVIPFVATTISDDPGPEIRDAYGYEGVNRVVKSEWFEVVAAGQVEELAYTRDALASVERAVDQAREAVARLAAASTPTIGRVTRISQELDEIRADLIQADVTEFGLQAADELIAAAAVLRDLAPQDADVADTVSAAATSLLAAVETMSRPDALRPAFGVPDAYSRRDRGARTELLVRKRLLDEWVGGDRGAVPADALTRWRGRRARETRIAELLGRLGLHIDAAARAERSDLLSRMGDGDVVQIADRYGTGSEAKPLEPPTADEWWLAETVPGLAAIVGASSIEPAGDNVCIVRRGSREFTVEIPIDELADRSSAQARWEVAGRLAQAVQEDRLAEAEGVGVAEMAARTASGQLGPDILVAYQLSGLVTEQTPLSPADHGALGWVRAFREDYEASGWRQQRTLRRQLREFAHGKGLGQRSAGMADLAGLGESPDRQRKLEAVRRVDRELAGFIEGVGRRSPTMRSLAEPGTDRLMLYEPRYDDSYFEDLVRWLGAHAHGYDPDVSIDLREGKIVITRRGENRQISIAVRSEDLFGPDGRLAAGPDADSYTGLVQKGIERRRGELAIADAVYDAIARHAATSQPGAPGAVVANLALRRHHLAENPGRAISSRLKSDLSAYRRELEDAGTDLTGLPADLKVFLDAYSRHVPSRVRKRATSIAAQEREFEAAITAGKSAPSRVPTRLRYNASQLIATVGVGLGAAVFGLFVVGVSPWLAGLGFASALPLAFGYARQKRGTEAATEEADNRKLAAGAAAREREARQRADAVFDVVAHEAVRPLLESLRGAPVPAPRRRRPSGDGALAGRPADPETGATSFKVQLANNRQMASFGVMQALLFTGVASGQLPLAVATVGATIFQFFFLAVGESKRSGYRIRNWHRQRGYDDARQARIQRKSDLAQARQLRAGLTALTRAAGGPVLPAAAPRRARADVVARDPVHDLRPYRSLTVTQDWQWRLPGYTIPFAVAAGLTAVADPASALVVLANALFTGGIWSGIQAAYDALEEHNTDRRANQHALLARAGSRQRADQQIQSLLEDLYSALQQVLPEPDGGWPALPTVAGQPLAQRVAPEEPAPVMPSFLASQLLVGVTAGSIEAGIVLAFLLLPFANSTHARQTLLSGAEYTDSTSIFGVLGDRPLLNGPRGLQGLTAAQAFYRVLQELLQVDDRALTDAFARIREWIAEALPDTGLPYLRRADQRSNRQAFDDPSARAVGRTPELVSALARFLFEQGLTQGVDPVEFLFEIVEDAQGIDALDFQEQLARTSTTEDLVQLGPGAFDDGLPLLAEVLLHEFTRVEQRRRGVTDPHDPAARAEAEAAEHRADGIDWDAVAIEDGTLRRWAAPHSPQTPRTVAAADWLYSVANIADAAPGHTFAGQPEQPADIAEVERSVGNGTARFQRLIAPGYEHNLTAPQAWQTVEEELRQATSVDRGHAEETGRPSAHGAYAVVAMRFADGGTLHTYARYYDPADPGVPDDQRGVYYFDPRNGTESRRPMAGEPEVFDVLVYKRDGEPRVLLREHHGPEDGGPRWLVRPRGTFSTETVSPTYFAAARAADPVTTDLLEIAFEFPSAGIHAGGLGTVFDETVLELARRGHRVLALVPQPLAGDPTAHGAASTRWQWVDGDRAPQEMRDLVTPLVAGLPEAFAHQADKDRDDEQWAVAAGDAMINALYDYIAATGRFPDNVVVHDWVATQVAHVLGIDYMSHVHAVEAGNTEGDVSDPLLARKVAQETRRYGGAAHVFVNSPHMRAAIEWLFGIPPTKITVVANGTDLGLQLRAGRDPVYAEQLARQAPQFDEVRARIEGLERFGMYVGRGIEAKGVEDLLEAWPEVKRAFPGVPLVIAGIARDGAPPAMDRLVAEGRLDESDVIFLGFVSPGLRTWVATHATFGVVPSRWEPFGVVANEFAAMGKPIVASSWISFVEHGWNGLSVPPKEPAALASAVRRVLRHLDKARAMAELGHDKAQTEFYTWPWIVAAKEIVYREVRGGRAVHDRIDPPAPAAIARNHNVFNIYRIYVDQGDGLTLSEGAGTFGSPLRHRDRDGVDDRGSYWDIPLLEDATELHVQIHRGDQTLSVQGQSDLSVPVKTGRRVFEGGSFYNRIRYRLTEDGLTAHPAEPEPPSTAPLLATTTTPSGFVLSPAVSDADAVAELEKLGPELPSNATAVERIHFAMQTAARAAAGLGPDAAFIDAVRARASVEEAFPVGQLADDLPGTFYTTSTTELDLRGTLAESGRTADELETDGYHAVTTAQRAIDAFYADEANHDAWVVIQITSFDPAMDQFSAHPFLASRGENGHVYYFELAPAMKHASRDWLYLPGWGPGLDGVVAVELAAFNARDDGTLEPLDLGNLPGLTPVEDITIRRPAPPPPGDDAASGGVDYKRGDRGEFVAPEQHVYPTSSDDVESVAGHVSQVLTSLGDLASDADTIADRRSAIQQVATLQLQIQAQADAAAAAVEAYRDAGDPAAEVPQQFRALVNLLRQQSRVVRSHWPQVPVGTSVMVTVDPVNPLGMTKIAMGDSETATFDALGVARAVAYLESVAESDAHLGVPDAERFTVDDMLVGQALTAVPLSRRGIAAAELSHRIDEQTIDDPYAIAVLERRSGRAAILPTVSVASFCSALVHEHQHRALGDLGPLGVTTPERGWVDDQAASRQEYRQLAARQGNHAACVRAEQVFWQAAIRAADNYGLVFPAAPGRVAPTGDAWLAAAEPGEILQIMPSLPSPVVSDEAAADADLAAITEQIAALAAPDHDASEDALARHVRANLALHQRIEAFCEAHPDRFQVRNFDPLDETGMLGTAPRVDRATGRLDVRDLAQIIAKVQLVCAAGDDNVPALRDLLATLGDVSDWPALAVWVAEPTRGWSGVDLRPQLADGVLTVPVALDDPPSLLDLAARYVQGLIEAAMPDMQQVRAQTWAALSNLPAPAKVLRHEYSYRLAREQSARETAADSSAVAFLRRVVRSAIRTEVDRETADRLAALVRSRLDDLERADARRELPDGRSSTLQTSYVGLNEMRLALIGLDNMLEDEHDEIGPLVQPLLMLFDDNAWPSDPTSHIALMRTTARNLVGLHERAVANLAHPVSQRARSTWRDADLLNPAFLMHHRALVAPDQEQLRPIDQAIVLAAVAKFAPPHIAAVAGRVPVTVVSARHLANPDLHQALLDSPRGVFRFAGAVYVLPNLPMTDLISGLVEALTRAPASAQTESHAEQALHLEYERWSNLDTLYDNLVADLQRSGMSIEDAVALALPPGAEETHAESRTSPATLAAALLDRLPAELIGAITPRRAYDLVVRYRTEPAAPAPSERVAGLPAARYEPSDTTADTGTVAQQDDHDAASFALREQFVLWQDSRALYDLAIRHLEAIGVSRHDATAFALPPGQAELYADARTRPSALAALLLDRLPFHLRHALTPHEAYTLVVSWLSPPADAQPTVDLDVRQTARDAVPLALHLQAARWRNYQLVYDGLVSMLESSGMAPQDVVDFLRPDIRPANAETGVSSGALAAVLGELPAGRWPSLPLDEGIELLWPYLEQRAVDDPSLRDLVQPAGGGEGFIPDDPLGLYRSHPPFPSAWSNSKFFTDNTFEGQSFGDLLMAGTTERLTAAQTEALHSYTTGIGYREISRALEDEVPTGQPVPSNIRPIVTDIDQAFDAATPLDRDVVVVRAESPSGLGVGLESELPQLIGTKQRKSSYTSTTMGAWPPLWGEPRSVVVRLRVPAGTKALYLGPFSTAHHEVELLLPRGLTTRIVAVQRKFSAASATPRDVWFVDMEVVGSPPTSP